MCVFICFVTHSQQAIHLVEKTIRKPRSRKLTMKTIIKLLTDLLSDFLIQQPQTN